ncbi:MAG TPA: prolyl oligopeptidase family serine peptidase [Bryobacteraceae bacterium]|jgi:dipeptidyl aminopeptidase/acylaminoacyl peptidase|nr:prolyl oligopeptidase family serine peptidase [Bryobacteraceae bacterium]
MPKMFLRALPWLALSSSLFAQTKLPPTPAEYGQWETLVEAGGGGRGGGGASGLSPDGKWLVYGINRSNGNNDLRATKIADATTKTIAFGTQPAFSSDSQWLAYGIGYSESQADRLRKDEKPVQNKLGLMNLATGEQTVIDAIQGYYFSPDGKYLAMRHYPPEAAAGGGRGAAAGGRGGGGGRGGRGGGANGADDNTPGATLIVRQLATGRDTSFGNVSEVAWQNRKHTGSLLAMAISTPDKTGNGIQLYDAKTGSLRVLDSGTSTYSNFSWRKDSSDLAALKSKTDEKKDGPTYIVLTWKNLGDSAESAHAYDPTADQKFPAGLRTVSYRRPSWSEDPSTLFIGLAEWYPKPASATPATGRRGGRGGTANADSTDEADDQPTVDVWHWKDIEVMAYQSKNASQEGRRNMLAALHIDSGSLTQLGHEVTEQVTPLKHHNLAYAAEWKDYALERSIGRPFADIYLVDTNTGQRTKIHEKLSEDRYLEESPGGRYLVYLDHDQYNVFDVTTKANVNITKNIKTSFVNVESDSTAPVKPPFGVAGWTKNDAEVILYDKYDLWKVSPDGSKPVRLTSGAADETRYRYVRLDPEEESIDLSKPVYMSLFGVWSKKSGYAVLRPGASAPEKLVWADKSIERLAKATDAPVFEYVSETYEESPNVFVGGPDLKDAKRVSDTNAFQSKYAWGHTELIEYKDTHGTRLQGTLYYPAGYEAGKKYPMIVYMYEKLSDGLHRYNAPSERSYYSASAITTHGYFLLEPDIVFQRSDPGLSVADCVTTAVKKVAEKGVIDEKKVGVVGHSWGGFDAAFLATHTHVFAAAVAGAPITDLVSNYGNHHWSNGIAETDHIETGQQRMGVPLYEDLNAYIRNSAVFAVSTMTTPLMIEVGDADGTVFYHQGVELYNIARRAKKNVVLLVYQGEDHGLRKKADQIDYQHRIFAWFGHYLKDEPAPTWITEGESYLDHQRDLKKVKTQ